MWIGWIEFDILLGDVHSLKEKRSWCGRCWPRSSGALTSPWPRWGTTNSTGGRRIGAGLVAADRAHLVEVLTAVERFVAARAELELLSARQRELRSED